MLSFAEENAKLKEKVYHHVAEVWDEKKCARLAKRKSTDAYGTKDHLAGFIRGNYGFQRYNGLIERDGELYGAEDRPLPIVADGFEIVYEPTWFYRIVKKEIK